MKILSSLAAVIAVAVGSSCQFPNQGQESEVAATHNASTFRANVNKLHLHTCPNVQWAPQTVDLPIALRKVSNHVLLSQTNSMQREGAQCNLPGYSKLKLPVTASYVTLYLTDRPPVRTDPLSVVIVTEPSWVMVYPLGTRVVEFTAYFDMAGHLVEDLPVRVQDFVVTTPRRVSTPPNARQVTGYLEDAQVQAFIQRL